MDTNQTFNNILSSLDGLKKCGDGYMALCPAHNDHDPSLSLKLADNGKILLKCFAGCETADICEALGISLVDLSPRLTPQEVFGEPLDWDAEIGEQKNMKSKKPSPPPTYCYHDTEGRVLFGVIRTPEKKFLQCRPDGNGGWWYGLDGIKPVLYRLPEIIQAVQRGEVVCVAEGEKDCDNLVALGLTATTNPMGAGKWRSEYSEYLRGADVVIFQDNDKQGRKHTKQVAQSLNGVARSVKVVGFPELSEKGDVSDWLTFGHTKDELLARVAVTPLWEPNHEEPKQGEEAEKTETQNENGKSLKFVCMADVEPEEVHWLWEPYIPKGKITLLEGDPAAGKTFIALAITAAVSTGGPFPDSENGRCIGRRKPGNVIFMTAEDGLGDTLRPRLDSMKANVRNVYAITGTVDEKGEGVFSFDDLNLLDGMAASLNPELIVIDPLQAFLGAGVDMHRANETRPVLSRLAALAERRNCAILILRHLSKANTTKSIYRGMGSIDFTAAARSVLLAGCDPEDKKIRAIAHIKSSLAPAGASQGYSLTLRDGFQWTGISDMTASTILGSEATAEKSSKLDETIEWLKSMLVEPKEKRDIEEMAEIEGISKITLRRAAKKLGVKSYKKPGEKNGPYIWEFPGNNYQNGTNQRVDQPDFPQGQTMINPSTRKKPSNDAGSTGCSRKNDDQPVEASSGAENGQLYGLIKTYPWDGQPDEHPDGQPVNKTPIGNCGKTWEIDWDDI